MSSSYRKACRVLLSPNVTLVSHFDKMVASLVPTRGIYKIKGPMPVHDRAEHRYRLFERRIAASCAVALKTPVLVQCTVTSYHAILEGKVLAGCDGCGYPLPSFDERHLEGEDPPAEEQDNGPNTLVSTWGSDRGLMRRRGFCVVSSSPQRV